MAIAAAKAGAVPVVASDIDGFAERAIALNAEANGVYVEVLRRDLLDDRAGAEPRYDVILAGDVFYERQMPERAFAFLLRHSAAGTQILIGDLGRTYLPGTGSADAANTRSRSPAISRTATASTPWYGHWPEKPARRTCEARLAITI